METKKIIEKLTKDAFEYKNAISNNIIERCPFIVEVGALTVGTDNKGVVIVQNVRFPMQFTQNTVDEILSMNWKNGNNEPIKPIAYGRNDWYRYRLKMVEESIELFEKQVNNSAN